MANCAVVALETNPTNWPVPFSEGWDGNVVAPVPLKNAPDCVMLIEIVPEPPGDWPTFPL